MALSLAVLSAVPAGAVSPPVVVFQAESGAGWAMAQRCQTIWHDEGGRLTELLLPANTATDTVVCQVLSTASFGRVFGSRLPDWGVGVALSSGQLIAVDYSRLPAVGRGLREVFLHEMVHALLFQGSQGQWLPTWIHEGAAMRYAGEWRFVDTVSLLLDGQVPALERLQGPFPSTAQRADRAYRTSLLAVDRLVRQYGDTVIRDLVAATGRRTPFAVAFGAVTGTSDREFYRNFAAAMHWRYGWLVLATRWPGMFAILALVLLIGGGRKLYHTRRRLAEMDDDPDDMPDETPDETPLSD